MRLKFLIAFLLLFPALARADEDHDALNACILKAQTNAEGAYEDGIRWRVHGGRLLAEQCVAMAKIGLGQYEEGAQRLYAIANAPDGGTDTEKTDMLVKSANAFLLAELPEGALKALDMAIGLNPDNADILIDHARASAMEEKWPAAEQDLTKAMKLRGPLALALRLRAEALMRQGKNDAAMSDINQALQMEPKEVDNYVERGRIREAVRTGHSPD